LRLGGDPIDAGRVSTRRHRRKAEAILLLALAGAGAPTSSTAQTISTVSNMSFGSFVAGTGGTLTIKPGGTRTSTGGVVVLGQGSTFGAASFLVSGTRSATYTLTMPTNGTVVLSDGAHTMALNDFAVSPSNGHLSGGGTQTIRIGATLTVANGQPAGQYTGTYSVTVNY
jgi:hypothetical protein